MTKLTAEQERQARAMYKRLRIYMHYTRTRARDAVAAQMGVSVLIIAMVLHNY